MVADAAGLGRHALVAEARRAQAGGGGGAPLRQVPRASASASWRRPATCSAARSSACTRSRSSCGPRSSSAERLWERRPDHRDFLHVRVGQGTSRSTATVELDLGMNPLAEYQTQSLHEAAGWSTAAASCATRRSSSTSPDIGVLAVTGDRDRSRAWARGLMIQLAAWRAPHDLRVVTAFDARDAGDWEWGSGCRTSGSTRRARAAACCSLARASELEALLEPRDAPAAGPAAPAGRRRPARAATSLELAAPRARRDRRRLDAPTIRSTRSRRSASCSTRARAAQGRARAADRRARRRSPRTSTRGWPSPSAGRGTWEVWGQDAPTIPEVRLDEVDLGIAEAIARTLDAAAARRGRRRRRARAGRQRPAGRAAGRARRATCEPARAPRPRAEALRAPIGRTADGEVLWLDLKQAAEDGMGPHGVLVGATGSGKSELLRSLVAGLAATHGPQQLAFVLVDYKGGAAFADLARLPHVAGMITNLSARPVAGRPHARRADRRAGAPPDDAARGRQRRRHRRLPGARAPSTRRCRRCPTCW